jgi:hypothetical protein
VKLGLSARKCAAPGYRSFKKKILLSIEYEEMDCQSNGNSYEEIYLTVCAFLLFVNLLWKNTIEKR